MQTAEFIPLDARILEAAATFRPRYGLAGQDSIVLASVPAHLDLSKPDSCLLNRNSKDFDDPDILERLQAYGCRFFSRFDSGLRYILSRARL
jgi:hypothetical protein